MSIYAIIFDRIAQLREETKLQTLGKDVT